MLDCAEFYNNEEDVGSAIEECLTSDVVKREDLYVASKIWTTTIFAGKEAVIAQVEKSVKDLKCGYLDLVNVHWPVPMKVRPYSTSPCLPPPN